METETELEVQKEKEEKKGAGFFAHFLNKLGLGGAAGESAGISIGSSAVGAAGGGGLSGGGILATKAGIVALIVAGTTVAAGIGVVGRSALSGKGGGVTDGIYSLFPGKSPASSASQAAGVGGASGGASSSLDYMAQAAKNDPFLQQEGTASAENAASASTPDPAAPGQVAAPDHTNAPANVSSARIGGPKLAKMQGFANASSGGGGSMSAAAPGGSDARNQGAARVGGLTAMSRGMSAGNASSRRALVGSKGQRAGDQARFAKMDGGRALGSRNPSMAAAGRTFDGAGAPGQQSSPAGAPSAQDGGGIDGGARDRFTPNKTLDTRELPPVKKAEGEQDATPYKTQMWIAVGALVVAMALAFFAGKVKDAANKMPAVTPVDAAAKAAKLQMAAMLHLAAAAAGAVAVAMGMIIMTAYGQKMQGMLLAGVGGIVAAFNLYNAYNVYSDSKDVEANRTKAMEASQQNIATEQAKLDKLYEGGASRDAILAQEQRVADATTSFNNYHAPQGGWPNGGAPTEPLSGPLQNGQTINNAQGEWTWTDGKWVQ